MCIDEIIKQLDFEEKALLITGAGNMATHAIERLDLQQKYFADGPHGVRGDPSQNCTSFPALCCAGASWDTDMLYKMGEGLAAECIEHHVDMLLGPGINIKRLITCGRNFEYISEDPVLSGEMGAAYINGLQSKGVGASLKHFAMNNQEQYRHTVSVEADLRTMREIYLKSFEIAVKKSSPVSVMCAYNKINSIWCSENRAILTEILREEWGYDGFVVSDWGAVHDICKAIKAGLDLQMPKNNNIVQDLKQGIKDGVITEADIDRAVRNILKFITKEKPAAKEKYDRKKQHELAKTIAASGVVLLKNDNEVLPVTKEKYKKIAVIGEFADKPLINGYGSAEVYPDESFVDSPLEELKKLLKDDVEIEYRELYKKREYPDTMVLFGFGEYVNFIRQSDALIIFAGSMTSEDTEHFDRKSAYIDPNYEFFINTAVKYHKKVIVVLQTGGAMILGSWKNKVSGIVQMWLGGESAGSVIAEILTGKINPSGKLSETFPSCPRKDIEYPGDENKIMYKEGFEVGYRYYDKHTDEICYPFGHGLSYTKFEYSDLEVSRDEDKITVQLHVENVGHVGGAEIVQIYVGKEISCVSRPIKELKAFKKVTVEPGKSETVKIELDTSSLAYYNVLLREWVIEPGEYTFYAAASSQDIRLEKNLIISDEPPYSVQPMGSAVIG